MKLNVVRITYENTFFHKRSAPSVRPENHPTDIASWNSLRRHGGTVCGRASAPSASSRRCLHRAVPLAGPSGYHQPEPWQSGHADVSRGFKPAGCSRLASHAVIASSKSPAAARFDIAKPSGLSMWSWLRAYERRCSKEYFDFTHTPARVGTRERQQWRLGVCVWRLGGRLSGGYPWRLILNMRCRFFSLPVVNRASLP